MAVYFHGGDATEDIYDHLRPHLQQVKGLEVCSGYTSLHGIEELATDTLTVENPSTGVKHDFNVNKKLNELLVKSLKQMGLLKKGSFYDLDYGNQVQPNEKYDSERTYKGTCGY